jgi:hypothetical protein
MTYVAPCHSPGISSEQALPVAGSAAAPPPSGLDVQVNATVRGYTAATFQPAVFRSALAAVLGLPASSIAVNSVQDLPARRGDAGSGGGGVSVASTATFAGDPAAAAAAATAATAKLDPATLTASLRKEGMAASTVEALFAAVPAAQTTPAPAGAAGGGAMIGIIAGKCEGSTVARSKFCGGCSVEGCNLGGRGISDAVIVAALECTMCVCVRARARARACVRACVRACGKIIPGRATRR